MKKVYTYAGPGYDYSARKTGHSLSIHYQNLCVAMFVPEGLAKFGTHHQKG